MSQYYQEQYYGQPAMDPSHAQPKTSGMAITALVMALVGVVPCCGWVSAPLGALLGLIAIFRIGGNPMLKGRGMAVFAMLLGVVISIGWAIGGVWGWNEFVRPIMQGPKNALIAGHNGDIAAFKAEFVGAGATASDEVAQAFLDELESRYGKFQSSAIDDQGTPPSSQTGQPTIVMPYRFVFENRTVSGYATYEMTDPMSQQLIQKWSEIVIEDSTEGDLIYPPPQSTSGVQIEPGDANDADADGAGDASADEAGEGTPDVPPDQE
jgi:hypothetical protein